MIRVIISIATFLGLSTKIIGYLIPDVSKCHKRRKTTFMVLLPLDPILQRPHNRPRKTLEYLTPIEYSKNYYNTDPKSDVSHLQI